MKIEKEIFIDTSAFIAIKVEDDINHKKAQQFLSVIKEKRLRLHTTNFVLDQVYTYFCKSHAVAIEMAELIMNNALILLHRVAVEDENKAIEILKAFKDKDFPYTDSTSFAVMERLGIKIAFAFDDHFTQYGKFTVVPWRDRYPNGLLSGYPHQFYGKKVADHALIAADKIFSSVRSFYQAQKEKEILQTDEWEKR